MTDSDDHIALAAEYALGTLDADERAQVEAMMAADKAFAATVQAWEVRLGALNQMVGPVEPRSVVWDNIKTAIRPAAAPQELPPEPPAASLAQEAEPVVPDIVWHASAIDEANVIRLERSATRWRNIASAASALAAALVAMLALQVYLPNVLPNALRPAPRIQTVEVRTPAPPLEPSAQYVALLQGAGGGPAFILTIDGATRNFTVRKVGAEPEPGKSFELWLISDKLPAPRSLGVIGAGDFTARPALSAYDPDLVNAATYAVTVEPAGGSPTGQPTSAPVFSGRLIETVPPSQPPARK